MLLGALVPLEGWYQCDKDCQKAQALAAPTTPHKRFSTVQNGSLCYTGLRTTSIPNMLTTSGSPKGLAFP